MIYLDHNATSIIRPEVRAKIVQLTQTMLANPSSIHQAGNRSRSLIEQSRQQMADFFQQPEKNHVIFTASGSEANNTIMRSFAPTKIAISGIEHPSILRGEHQGSCHKIKVMANGEVDLNHLEQLLAQHQLQLVSIMLANNEVGTLQPMQQIAKLCQQHGVLLHSDCTQALGRIKYQHLKQLIPYFDFITACFHKCGGMIGVGAIITKHTNLLKALIHGGDQEHKLRAGTENTLLIATLPTILEQIRNCDQEVEQYQRFKDIIATSLPATAIFNASPAIANTLAITMLGVERQTQLMHFDMNDIAIGIGSACSSGSSRESHVLAAIGFSKKQARSTIRISMGWNTSKNCVITFINSWHELYQRSN